MKKIAIIGIGNILKTDDGIGIEIVKQMMECPINSVATIVDGGTSTLDTLGYFMDYEKIIVIDALKGGNKPGTIYKLKAEDILEFKRENLSIHDVQIFDVVKMANILGYSPEVMIFGVEPKSLEFNIGLTDELQEVIPKVIKLVESELK